MGLFGKKKVAGDKEIDFLVDGIKVDLSNNYKDSASAILKRMKTMV